jgi:hypothetical protein
VAEGARTCPFSRQYRIELASWTANKALSNVLEAKLNDLQQALVLQDRGLFDALAFLKLLHLEGKLSEETFSHFAGYFTNTRWTSKVDLIILLDIEPEEAVKRDLAAILSDNPALITNVASMMTLRGSYEFVLECYGRGFPRVERIDTTHLDRLETARKAISIIQELIIGQA